MFRNVLIGIHVDSQIHRATETLGQLQDATLRNFRYLILGDGLSENDLAVGFPDEAISNTPRRMGAASCFNRLISRTGVDVYVFLEAGVLVGTGWLTHLLEALAAGSDHGLAGPSTNRSWNEQAVLSRSSARRLVNENASELATRYDGQWTESKPLYGLSAFCYAVRAETALAVGPADTVYGVGPCWEMDYSVRAARMGYKSIWARSAYVWRPPISRQRARDEERLLEINKRHYQDRFCNLHLSEQKTDYCAHCEGAACSHFALETGLRKPHHTKTPLREDSPLVSCVMPTRGRAPFVALTLNWFRRQTYANRELIIVYEEPNDLPADLREGPMVRLVRTDHTSIGAKRNIGNAAARGEFIAQWDDDDWYAPGRLSEQIQPLRDNAADISGLYGFLFFQLAENRLWRCDPSLFGEIFMLGIASGTLVYRKSIWDEGARYPELNLREDAVFLERALTNEARLAHVPGDHLFVYLRHGANSWQFETGIFRRPEAWSRVATPPWFADDRQDYTKLVQAPKATPPHEKLQFESAKMNRSSHLPMVSCIMPTCDREAFVSRALHCFLNQDYEHRELIVVDDSSSPIRHLIPDDSRLRYLRLEEKTSLGEKRNIACRMARGSVIAHWDDDDWAAPEWLALQVYCLIDNRADVCGMDKIIFFDPMRNRAWHYLYPPGERPWVCGGTLCYTKEFWERNPFRPRNLGEDNEFLWGAGEIKLCAHTNTDHYIACIHPGNTSPKKTTGGRWQPIDAERIRELTRDYEQPSGNPSRGVPIKQPLHAPDRQAVFPDGTGAVLAFGV